MDRKMLLRHLALAEEHIVTGERNIARQKKISPSLKCMMPPTSLRRGKTLADFEHTQELFVAGFLQIKEALERGGPP
jgi:hypothetical protein